MLYKLIIYKVGILCFRHDDRLFGNKRLLRLILFLFLERERLLELDLTAERLFWYLGTYDRYDNDNAYHHCDNYNKYNYRKAGIAAVLRLAPGLVAHSAVTELYLAEIILCILSGAHHLIDIIGGRKNKICISRRFLLEL